ncbi:hypothetical protein FrCorBMG51_03340 [Protofrankia coriariae]|uniref:Uncharacterized protein n=1 Tax=Protofrankia coriariae TaxID=1562887 RepID=A0ABR5F7Q7_9ACTN|nr:hypothetical protein FrCorBMG51_03340 [Protofrankia coriariae]
MIVADVPSEGMPVVDGPGAADGRAVDADAGGGAGVGVGVGACQDSRPVQSTSSSASPSCARRCATVCRTLCRARRSASARALVAQIRQAGSHCA